MDYEKILFDLKPILDSSNIDDITPSADSKERYLSVLDELAVCLRSEHNRIITGLSGLVKSILLVLEKTLARCFDDSHLDPFWLEFASSLIRCTANSLLDNDENRSILLKEAPAIMDNYVGKLLSLKLEGNEELHLRTLALAKNMCIDGDDTEYVARFAKIQIPLLNYLRRESNETRLLIGSDLLRDLVQAEQNVSLEDLQFFAEAIRNWSKKVKDQNVKEIKDEAEEDDEEDDEEGYEELEDPALDIMRNFNICLELVVAGESSLDFSDPSISTIEANLLQTLDELWPKQFENKLIFMRRLLTCVGHISAQESAENKRESKTCYEIIRKSNNGYQIGAAFMILGNSIDSPSEASYVSKDISFKELIQAASKLTDPMQMQGFLALCRKLLNISTAIELNSATVRDLSVILKRIHDQSFLFQEISPLVDALLNKIFTVLPSSTVYDSLLDPNSPLFSIIKERDSLICCLALDKLLVSSKKAPDSITEPLWQTACKSQDNVASNKGNISIFYIFQLAKTFGILLKNLEADHGQLTDNFKPWITQLLEFIQPLKSKNDQASQSAVNNGKFVATMLLRLLDQKTTGTEQDEELKTLSKELL